ncbi:DUF397 domain-containing protein [Amycolatopsis samaneae]|uniref:DUF397 domain-containing protein n=1 Tax=Amycolatopsis samaneae TaxID=664691 RepID=A0ABW5GN99_9PSEU
MTSRERFAIGWRTSSYTTGNGNCVEVGWRVSTHTAGQGNCVEVAPKPDEVLIRDTKDRDGGTLSVGHAQWRALLTRTTA